MAIIGLVAINLVKSQRPCENIQYDIGECLETRNFTKTAFFYPENRQECSDSQMLKPLENIPCQFECDAGEYFSIDAEKREYSCQKCPENTYSTGGGLLVDGDFGEWTQAMSVNDEFSIKSQLNRKCYKFYWQTWVEDQCTPCSSTEGGATYYCGEAQAMDTSVAFETELRVFMVKQGYIELLYRKDSVLMEDGWVSGIFEIYKDGEQIIMDNLVNDDQHSWKLFKYELNKGMNDIIISYQKYNSQPTINDKLEIKKIRIVGTDYSSTECKRCQYGYSQGECIQCPEGSSCPRGTIATQIDVACQPIRNCTEEEIPKIYDDTCYYSKFNQSQAVRYFTYNLSAVNTDFCKIDPKIYKDSNQKYEIPCDMLCEQGQVRVENKAATNGQFSCEVCAHGMYSVFNQDKTCGFCHKGSYLERGLDLSRWTSFPKSEYNITSKCIDGKGQKCHNSDGFIPVLNKGLLAGERERVDTTLYLSMNLFIIENINKNFQNQRIQIDYELSNFTLGVDEVNITINKNVQSSEASKVTITRIIIVGTLQENEGAITCNQCPSGFINQHDKQEQCSPCNSGYTSNKMHLECSQCPENMFSFNIGSECQLCPENTEASKSKQNCQVMNHLLTLAKVHGLNNAPLVYHALAFSTNPSYDFSKTSSISQSQTNVLQNPRYNICQKQGQFCEHQYFGPVLANIRSDTDQLFKNQFYISPLTRSNFTKISEADFELSKEEKESFNPNSFITGLFDTSLVEHYSTLQGPGLENACPSSLQGQNQRVIKSLGSNIKQVELQKQGFTVKYNNGDDCFYDKNQRKFSSEIRFICDLDESDGWPVLLMPNNDEKVHNSYDLCHPVFEWKSKFACRHCLKNETTLIQGLCNWNYREVKVEPSDTCMVYSEKYLDEMNDKKLLKGFFTEKLLRETLIFGAPQESCVLFEDFMQNQQLMIGIAGIVITMLILFMACGVILCRYKKLKTDYYEKIQLIRDGAVEDGRNNLETETEM
eukprot:403370894